MAFGDESLRMSEITQVIDAIAERTGFPNRHHFIRVFKGVTGESPALFRQRHGEGGLGRKTA